MSSSVQRRTVYAIAIFAFFYITFGAWLTSKQEALVYHPDDQVFEDCPALADAEHLRWGNTRMYATRTGKPVVVLYHGNAGSACDRAFYTTVFTQSQYDYLLVEYTGYSNDTKESSHLATKANVHDVLAYLEHHDLHTEVVIGESIGTGLASYHSSLRAPDGLILLTPFTDLQAVAATRFWFYPTGLLVDNAFDNVAALAQYRGETLIIHGTEDTIIPLRLGVALADTLTAPTELVTIPKAGHNDLVSYPETWDAIYDFLTRISPQDAADPVL